MSLGPVFTRRLIEDPYAVYRQLREAVPVYHDPESGELVLTPRVREVEAIEQNMAMVERWHRILARLVRTMQELRRQGPSVVVGLAKEVNVGGLRVTLNGRE